MSSAAAPATLLALYSAMGVWVTVQEVQLVSRGHRVLHYKSLFNLFVAAWMALRVVFWSVDLSQANVPQLLQDLIFWLPHTAMFLTFATLALFLAKVAHGPGWSGVLRRRYLRVYGAVATLNIVDTVAFSVLDAQFAASGNAGGQAAIQTAESVENGVLFLLLAGVFVALGRQLRALGVWEFARATFMLPPRTVSVAVWSLAAIFSSRCVWNFLTAAGAVDVNTSDASLRSTLTIVGMYVLWEFAPLVLLLTTIAGGPVGSASSSDAAAKGAAAAHMGVFEAIDELMMEGGDDDDAAAGGGRSGGDEREGGGGGAGAQRAAGQAGATDDAGAVDYADGGYERAPMLARQPSSGASSSQQPQPQPARAPLEYSFVPPSGGPALTAGGYGYGGSSSGGGGLGVSGGLIGGGSSAGGLGAPGGAGLGGMGLGRPGLLFTAQPGSGLLLSPPPRVGLGGLGGAPGGAAGWGSAARGAGGAYGGGIGGGGYHPATPVAGRDDMPLSPNSEDGTPSPQHGAFGGGGGSRMYPSIGAGGGGSGTTMLYGAAAGGGGGGGGLGRTGSGFLFGADGAGGLTPVAGGAASRGGTGTSWGGAGAALPPPQPASAGFLSAQQNAARRTTYVPPTVPMGQ